jgi:hypothetical protein
MLTDRDDYIERLEKIALNDDGHRCETCGEVWDVADIARYWTPSDPRPTICKRCAA